MAKTTNIQLKIHFSHFSIKSSKLPSHRHRYKHFQSSENGSNKFSVLNNTQKNNNIVNAIQV